MKLCTSISDCLVASLEPLYFIHENSPVAGSSAETLAAGWESCTEPEQVAY